MWTRQRKNTNRHRLIVPGLALVFLSYFGFHIVHGDYGLNAKTRLERRIVELEKRRDHVTEERRGLETRLRLMQSGSIERDMLDERARDMLHVSRPDEIVVFY